MHTQFPGQPVERVHRHVEIRGFPFRIKVVTSEKIFGTQVVWREKTRVLVSDPARTMVDILDEPSIGGGIRHIAEILNVYFAADNRDDSQLIQYIHRVGNRAVFKRLGYLLETLGLEAPTLIETCTKEMSTGISLLDPTSPAKGQVFRRWNLRVNVVGVGRGAL